MGHDPSTLASSGLAIVRTLDARGCDYRQVFASAGLARASMEQSDARYPVRQMRRLWEAAVQATGDPCIGLRVAEHLEPRMMHALGLAWITSRTLLDGLRRLARFYRILSEGTPVVLDASDDPVTLTVDYSNASVQPPGQGLDAFFAVVVTMCRRMQSQAFAPRLLLLDRPRPVYAAEYEKYFGAPVVFESDRNCMEFDCAALAADLPAGNADLAAGIDTMAERHLAAMDPDLVSAKVRSLLVERLSTGEVTQDSIAKTLHRSLKTLQRNLAREGTSYRDILDTTRERLARGYLRERRYSLSETAFLLGFADASNFSRAFRRWTGVSPQAFRAQPAITITNRS